MDIDGLRKDGQPDKRMSSEHGASPSSRSARRRARRLTFSTTRAGFGGDKELAHDAGVKGGKMGQEEIGRGGPLDA